MPQPLWAKTRLVTLQRQRDSLATLARWALVCGLVLAVIGIALPLPPSALYAILLSAAIWLTIWLCQMKRLDKIDQEIDKLRQTDR